MAKEAGLLDVNGEILQTQFKTENVPSSRGGKGRLQITGYQDFFLHSYGFIILFRYFVVAIQMIAVPVSSPMKSPIKLETANVIRPGAILSNTTGIPLSGSPLVGRSNTTPIVVSEYQYSKVFQTLNLFPLLKYLFSNRLNTVKLVNFTMLSLY